MRQALDQINSGKLIISSANIAEIRKATGNIANTPPEVLDVLLYNVVTESYQYFNTAHSEVMIDLTVKEIKTRYKLHSIVEIVQAIEQGRRNIGMDVKIFGKLSPAHIMEWIRIYDENLTNIQDDNIDVMCNSQKKHLDRTDKYDKNQDPKVAELYCKLAENRQKKHKIKTNPKAKDIASDEAIQKHIKAKPLTGREKLIHEWQDLPNPQQTMGEYINEQLNK